MGIHDAAFGKPTTSLISIKSFEFISSQMSKMSTRVYVGGLNHRSREKDVERFFRKFGRIREISLKNGFCFVEFDDYRDADDACYEMNGRDLLGERVSVEIVKSGVAAVAVIVVMIDVVEADAMAVTDPSGLINMVLQLVPTTELSWKIFPAE